MPRLIAALRAERGAARTRRTSRARLAGESQPTRLGQRVAPALLLAALALSSCQAALQPPGQQARASTTPAMLNTPAPTPSHPPPTPSHPPRAWQPVKPAPTGPPLNFPDCQVEPVKPYRFNAARVTPVPLPAASGPTLRRLAQARGLLVGTSTDPGVFEYPSYTTITARESNIVAVENAMKWEIIHPQAHRYDFSPGDALVDYAQANGLQVYAHVLAWELQQPAWLIEGERSRAQWIDILCRHIKTVVGHYRGVIYAWDVVNEPFQNSGELRDTLWLRVIGPEYIAMAFYWARQADPNAILVLNEHSAEGLNEKSEAVYRLAQGLLASGAPLDAVGLQMHVWLYGPPSAADLEANMRRLMALGLYVHITEMDVRLQYSRDPPGKELAEQAEIYRRSMAACLRVPACSVFITWGLTDEYNWISSYTGVDDDPVLLDRNFQPKPAYFAVLEALQR